MEVGNWVIWERFAPVLRGLVEKSKDFRTAKEAFCARLNGEYFLKCANVCYPPRGGRLNNEKQTDENSVPLWRPNDILKIGKRRWFKLQ